MGSGPAMIMSRKRVDDGQTHTVSVERLGRTGSLRVDKEDTVYGDSQGFLQMLNADGNIYIGKSTHVNLIISNTMLTLCAETNSNTRHTNQDIFAMQF